MRKTIIAGNWKMNGTRGEAESLVNDLLPRLAHVDNADRADVVICPPYTALSTVAALVENSRVALGAQDVFWKDKGAYTGQISPQMLAEAGCKYVIVGHSEPRGRFGVPDPDLHQEILAYFADSDAIVNRKLRAVQETQLIPILCVGETLAERQAGDTDAVISGQLLICLRNVTAEQISRLVIAYEPVWAIGTGEVCAAEEANRVCGVVRDTVGRLYGDEAAAAIQVLYGGSVKPENAKDLLTKPHIDGALVGGASLKAVDFAGIVAAV